MPPGPERERRSRGESAAQPIDAVLIRNIVPRDRHMRMKTKISLSKFRSELSWRTDTMTRLDCFVSGETYFLFDA